MSDEAPDDVAVAVHEALQGHDTSAAHPGGVLVGWVCVAEFSTPDGERWLSKHSGRADGIEAPLWQQQGYLHQALFGEWRAPSEDE